MEVLAKDNGLDKFLALYFVSSFTFVTAGLLVAWAARTAQLDAMSRTSLAQVAEARIENGLREVEHSVVACRKALQLDHEDQEARRKRRKRAAKHKAKKKHILLPALLSPGGQLDKNMKKMGESVSWVTWCIYIEFKKIIIISLYTPIPLIYPLLTTTNSLFIDARPEIQDHFENVPQSPPWE